MEAWVRHQMFHGDLKTARQLLYDTSPSLFSLKLTALDKHGHNEVTIGQRLFARETSVILTDH